MNKYTEAHQVHDVIRFQGYKVFVPYGAYILVDKRGNILSQNFLNAKVNSLCTVIRGEEELIEYFWIQKLFYQKYALKKRIACL